MAAPPRSPWWSAYGGSRRWRSASIRQVTCWRSRSQVDRENGRDVPCSTTPASPTLVREGDDASAVYVRDADAGVRRVWPLPCGELECSVRSLHAPSELRFGSIGACHHAPYIARRDARYVSREARPMTRLGPSAVPSRWRSIAPTLPLHHRRPIGDVGGADTGRTAPARPTSWRRSRCWCRGAACAGAGA